MKSYKEALEEALTVPWALKDGWIYTADEIPFEWEEHPVSRRIMIAGWFNKDHAEFAHHIIDLHNDNL